MFVLLLSIIIEFEIALYYAERSCVYLNLIQLIELEKCLLFIYEILVCRSRYNPDGCCSLQESLPTSAAVAMGVIEALFNDV